MFRLIPLSLLLVLLSCNSSNTEKHDGQSSRSSSSWTVPAPGTLIAADSIKVADDPLNNFYFSVRLSVPDSIPPGTRTQLYNVHATYGRAEADGIVAMPKGGDHLQPLLRRGEKRSFIVGFIPGEEYGGDTSFHEYYRVKGSMQDIEIVPLKGYSIN